MRNKLQVSSRVHRGRLKLPTESRQVPLGLSPEWGFTSMTPGEARGKKQKISLEPQRSLPRNPTGQAPSGLLTLHYPLPPVAPGAIIVTILRI